MLGFSSSKEILQAHAWLRDNFIKDQELFGTDVISMDVEHVTVSYLDIM